MMKKLFPVPGAYSPEVDKDRVHIAGKDEKGVFYGMETLIQLLPVEKASELAVPYASIQDAPRFAYRRMHLDVGLPAGLPAGSEQYIMGAQANVWTEYISNTKKVDYMIFPCMSALSEVLWSNKSNRNWDSFEKRMQVQRKRYDLWGVHYSKAFFDQPSTALN